MSLGQLGQLESYVGYRYFQYNVDIYETALFLWRDL